MCVSNLKQMLFVIAAMTLVGCNSPVAATSNPTIKMPIKPSATVALPRSVQPSILSTVTPGSPTEMIIPTVISTRPEVSRFEVASPQFLEGHSGIVTSLAFSPDGSILASTGADQTIRLWNVSNGQIEQVVDGGSGTMTGLDFSSDGQHLASIEKDNSIAVRDLYTGQVVLRINHPGTQFCGVAFSPNGAQLASGEVDGLVSIWSEQTGELQQELQGLDALSCPVAFSPDGSLIAAGGGERDNQVLIWDRASGKILFLMNGHKKYIYDVDFSPDGKTLASTSGDQTIKLWNTETGELIYSVVADLYKMSAVDFSPDGSLFVSVGIDGKVRVWDATSGQPMITLSGHTGEIYSVAFSPVDNIFATSGEKGEVLLWRITSSLIKISQQEITNKDTGLVVFYSERDGNAEIYTMKPDGSDQRPLTENNVDDVSPSWSPDGTLIVFESDRDDAHPRNCFPKCNYNLYVMNADGTQQRQLTSLPGAEWHADWYPDGHSLIFNASEIGYENPRIYRIELESGELQPLLVDNFSNEAPDWSPDGSQIGFSSNRDGDFDIFTMLPDGSGIHKVVDSGLNDYFPDWSPDGLQIAFFGADWPLIKQDIFTVESDGSNLMNLSNTPQIIDEDPKWCPDGSKIIFQSDRDRNFEIYIMNSDGSQPQNLTRNPGGDYWADW